MEAEAACIVCNWVNSVVWPYFGLGALGAAAAAAAAASGSFGGGGYHSGGADDAGADDSNPDPPSRRFPPGRSPQEIHRRQFPGAYPYTDSRGNPYWPGVTPIPSSGIVYPRAPYGGGENYTGGPLPVNSQNGMPIWPDSPLLREDGSTERPTASQGSPRG